MRTFLFLYNPFSGNRQNTKELDTILAEFLKQGVLLFPYRLYTQNPDTILPVLLEKVSSYFDGIVLSGGDGTVSTFINLLLEKGNTLPIGVLPTGTCNDFAKSIGMPTSLVEGIAALCNASPAYLDVGFICAGKEQRYFVNSVAGGVFVNVSYNTSPELKVTFGALAYCMEALRQLNTIRPFRLRIETEDQIYEEKALVFLILNGKGVAGRNDVLKNADMNDGKMDGMIIRDGLPIEKVSVVFNLLSGKVDSDKSIVLFSCSSCKISADAELNCSIDGEKGFSLPYSIQMLPRQLKVWMPPQTSQEDINVNTPK